MRPTLPYSCIKILAISLLLSACSSYRKGMDAETQFREASRLYEAGEHKKAGKLFGNLIPIYDLPRQCAEDIQYNYAICNYYLKDPGLALYYLNILIQSYPDSNKMSEYRRMQAICREQADVNSY
jgi:TolA-binding protein